MVRSEPSTLTNRIEEPSYGDNDAASSRKRRRSERSSPSDTKSKTSSRKTTPFKARKQKLENPEAGPSEMIASLSDSIELLPRNPKAPAVETTGPSVLENATSSSPRYGFDIGSAEAQLRLLKQNLVDAENQLRQERVQRAQQELQIRQDMCLEMIQAKESSQREIEKLDIHLRMASKLIDEKNQAMQELQQTCDSTSEALGRHVVEAEVHKRELEHLHHVNTTLEADIEELRQIHNESSARKRPPGLPPAYGSLDEEDMPPYELHADSGALNVATLKRVARDKYNKTLEDYCACDGKHPLAIDLSDAQDVQRFHQASLALYQAASTLSRALNDLHSEIVVELNARDKHTARKVAAKQDFVLSRVANILLELTWRTIALNEIRPAARANYSPRARAVLKAIYSQVDDVLLELLRTWNGGCRSNSNNHPPSEDRNVSRTVEFQVYLSQVTALRASLAELVGRSLDKWSVNFFGKSLAFLQEAVENERMQEAAADGLRERTGGDDAFAAFRRVSLMPQRDGNAAFSREGSVISSVGVADESGGEEG